MKKLITLLGITLLVSLILSACSGGGSNSTTLNITQSDFKFNPATWSVPAGKQVTVNLKNDGSVAHTWTIMKTPISGSYSSNDQSDVYFNSGPVNAGSSKTVTFTAPSTPGTYQVICTVQGHFEAGMVGQLTVK